MSSSERDDNVTVAALERVLFEQYGFTGSLKDIKFEERTQDSFPQLIHALKKQLVSSSAEEDATPKIGDRAFVYWFGNGWFTATIENWLPEELSYMIRWTDGNWAPERALHNNLCVDKVPSHALVGVGTKVLFKQGLYYCGHMDDGTVCDSSGRGLSDAKIAELMSKKQISDRWHMGQITSVTKNLNGESLYSGQHVPSDDPQYSRSTYVGHSFVFEGLKLEQLRTLPNIFNCMDSSSSAIKQSKDFSCDVFVSKVLQDDPSVRRITAPLREQFIVQESSGGSSSGDIQGTVEKIKNCSVYLVCLSDSLVDNPQAMSELLFAKNTLGKTVVPIVLGVSGRWQETTAGMLLAGQLYIQFGSDNVYDEKVSELQSNLEKLIVSDPSEANKGFQATAKHPPRVFISYCWSNSKAAHDAGQVGSFVGHVFSDPRKIKSTIEEAIGEKVWLDIEQLNSVNDAGMFGQIAEGLKNASVVVMCVSKEYTNSQNCRMEANFALRSLRKKTIVVEVGSGSEEDKNFWTKSSVGMVLPIDQEPFVFTEDKMKSGHEYNFIIDKICRKLLEESLKEPITSVEPVKAILTPRKKKTGTKENSLRASIPMEGDSVIAHYCVWQFFPAKVASFDKITMKYTVNWDDPDPTCRVQRYQLVAINVAPTDELIGIGTSILFKQGTYQYGNSTGDVWNLGEITSVIERDGVKLYSGKHSKTAADGLAVASWPSFRPTFEGARCHDLRLFPNAMEMLQAYSSL